MMLEFKLIECWKNQLNEELDKIRAKMNEIIDVTVCPIAQDGMRHSDKYAFLVKYRSLS